MPTPPVSIASSNSSIVVGAIVGVVVGLASTLFTLAVVACVLRTRSPPFIPHLWKSKALVRPAIDERPPSPPSTMPYMPSASFVLPASLFSSSQPPSPVVSSLYQSMETTNSRSVREVLLPSPSHSESRTNRGRHPSPLPPRHPADVPGPALSTTGTEHSTRITGLSQQILSLERELEALQSMSNALPPSRREESDASMANLWMRVRQLRKGVEREKRLAHETVPRGKW